MNQQQNFEPNKPRHECACGHESQVGPVNAGSLLGRHSRVVKSEPLKNYEIEERPNPEQDERMPMKPVLPPLECRKRPVLSHGEHQHVTATAPIKITGCRMMNGVVL